MTQDIASEMRWVATLMVDLVDSTALTERLGTEKAFNLIQTVLRRAVTLIEAEGGHVVDFAGDSLFAIFGAPVAIENAAICAARAALAIQEDNRNQAAERIARFSDAPHLRIGLAGGKVMVAMLDVAQDRKLNALGTAVNLAARVQALAGAGDILCAQAMADELEGFAQLEPIGERHLKGIAQPQTLHRLLGLLQDPSTLTGRMARGAKLHIGRDALVDRLHHWLSAPPEAAGQLVIHGPPGIGKSRLLRHVLDHRQSGQHLALAYCTPSDEGSSLEPVLNLLRAAARSTGAATPAAQDRWLRGLLGPDFPPGPGLMALLTGSARQSGLLTDEGARDALETRQNIGQALALLARDPEWLLVVEDAHWLDPISRAILSDLMAAPGARLLLTSRSRAPLRDDPGAGGRLDVTPLSQADIALLCAHARPGDAMTADLPRIIFQKSEGNPLFAEELLRHIAMTGYVQPLADMSAGNIGAIQTLIFSRFDRLGQTEKAALKLAALIGRQVRKSHLGLGPDQATQADRILSDAVQQGLLERQDDSGHWQFSHVLIQEAIANSIPDSEATALHLAATKILQAEAADLGGDLSQRLALHFEKAGLPARATPFHLAAAQGAWRVYALDLCLHHLERATAQIEAPEVAADDRLVADILTSYLRVLDVVGHWVTLCAVADRHMDRLRALADPAPLIFALTIRAKGANQCVDFVTARARIDEALALAEASGDGNGIAVVKSVKMDIVNDHADWHIDDVPRLFEETRAYADHGNDPHLAQLRLYEMASHYRQTGDIPAALAMADELIQLGTTRNDSRARAFGWWVRASVSAMIENYPRAEQEALKSMRNALPGTMDYSTANMFRISARIMAGDPSITTAFLKDLSAQRAALGDSSVAIIAAFFAAVLHLTRGEVRAGLAQLAHTDRMVDAGAERGLLQHYLIKKAEIFMTVAGLFPNPLPEARLPVAEIPTAIGLRLTARKRAKATYADLRARLSVTEGFHMARIQLGEGRIALAERRRKEADELLTRAETVFRAQGTQHFLDILDTFPR